MPPTLKQYEELFDTCTINPGRRAELINIAHQVVQYKNRYQAVADRLLNKMPWWFIALIHVMEGSMNFKRHLHNGDPLDHRTVNVPADRPLKGNPPFTWEESAEDALRLKQYHLVNDWSIPNIMYLLEKYNGMGYRRASININTPYLWSFTNQYKSGKFIADGHYDQDAVSKQAGAAAILKIMQEQKII